MIRDMYIDHINSDLFKFEDTGVNFYLNNSYNEYESVFDYIESNFGYLKAKEQFKILTLIITAYNKGRISGVKF